MHNMQTTRGPHSIELGARSGDLDISSLEVSRDISLKMGYRVGALRK